MKKICLIIMLIISIFIFSSCEDYTNYYGESFPLVVVARSSLLGVSGALSDKILILETDDYGREFFAFRGYSKVEDGDIVAIVISQKTTSQKVYYYDSINFCILEESIDTSQELTKSFISENFTQSQINQLKIENDWNLPIKKDHLFEAKVTRNKTDTVSIKNQKNAFGKVSEYFNDSGSILLSQDKNGLSLYYMVGIKYDYSAKVFIYDPAYLVMFDKDGNNIPGTGMMYFSEDSVKNYQITLTEFKQKNGWSFW